MTDDDVKEWLSVEERVAWNDSDNAPTPRASIGMRDVLRALAETRRALAALRSSVVFLFDAYVNEDRRVPPLDPLDSSILSKEGGDALEAPLFAVPPHLVDNPSFRTKGPAR